MLWQGWRVAFLELWETFGCWWFGSSPNVQIPHSCPAFVCHTGHGRFTLQWSSYLNLHGTSWNRNSLWNRSSYSLWYRNPIMEFTYISCSEAVSTFFFFTEMSGSLRQEKWDWKARVRVACKWGQTLAGPHLALRLIFVFEDKILHQRIIY